jgi:16S rRNA A1518/A1519 N6-dimethyltransferase RsmA/KsgA/DIM1 with predicted DNA glycosylase/AP lyase activity
LRPSIAAKLVGQVGIRSGDVVLEVGPGLGALTAEILDQGARVLAVERDADRVAHLRERFAAELKDGRLQLHHGDARRWKPELPARWRVLANPPFVLTSDLVRSWLLMPGGPFRIDLVLQREAAQKLCNLPSDRYQPIGNTLLGTLAAAAGRSRVTGGLQRDDVTPPSRVDLCWWTWTRFDGGPSSTDMNRLDRLLARGFAGPHTMTEALRGLATGIQLRRQGQEFGWNPNAHPRELTAEAWLSLAQLLGMCGKI